MQESGQNQELLAEGNGVLELVGAESLQFAEEQTVSASARVFHILPESEPFSDHHGGAISRCVANLLKDDANARIVCPWSDKTWSQGSGRILELPELKNYAPMASRYVSRIFVGLRYLALRRVFRAFCKQLKSGDVVYIHNRPEYVLAIQSMLPETDISMVLHLHNSHLRGMPGFLKKRLKVDRYVFVSEYLRSEIEDMPGMTAKSSILSVGADDARFFPSQKKEAIDPPVILFVGRLVPDKGVHVLLDAMRVLEARGVAAKARIIGSPKFGSSESSSYWERLKKTQPGNVEFLEYVSGNALSKEFRKASIFCCPSTWDEPFGMVNVEAMATALPVVATRAGGIPEVFQEGGALLVPKGSSVALADALQYLVENPSIRQELGKQGLWIFQKKYSWRELGRQYREMIREVATSA